VLLDLSLKLISIMFKIVDLKGEIRFKIKMLELKGEISFTVDIFLNYLLQNLCLICLKISTVE